MCIRAATLRERVEQALGDTELAVTLRELRSACKIRMESLCEVLKSLVAEGHVQKSGEGYKLARKRESFSVSRPL